MERFSYDHELALEQEDDLAERISRVSFILDGLQELMESAMTAGEAALRKCKDELVEQGILDMLMRTIEMIYYKTVPPALFEKPFKVNKNVRAAGDAAVSNFERRVDPTKVKIDDYIA